MADLIDREQAIDRINGTGYADQIKNNLMLILRELPSAEPFFIEVRCQIYCITFIQFAALILMRWVLLPGTITLRNLEKNFLEMIFQYGWRWSMIRISLTTWFADDEKNTVLTAHGIVGHLTPEQYEIARGWIYQMAEWTDENRAKMEVEHE